MLTKQRPIKAVLFDLDGTLLDTASDLGQALNSLRKAYSQPPLPLPLIRTVISQGYKGFLKIGFDIEENHPRFATLQQELLHYYHQHLFDTTQLFPGMEDVLNHLEQANIPWGIVTNKPEAFTLKLVEGLELAKRTNCVISGDTLTNRKPHPEPVLHACQLLQQQPSDCLYVGDAEIDIIAGKAAGTSALVALYGYIHEQDDPKQWNADGYIKQPLDILSWISQK